MSTATTAAAPCTAAMPTEEQIAMAWRHLRGRNGCPDTLPACAAHRTWKVALHGLAVNFARKGWAAGAHPSPHSQPAPQPQSPTAPPLRLGHYPSLAEARARATARLGAHDAKRAAANDKDD